MLRTGRFGSTSPSALRTADSIFSGVPATCSSMALTHPLRCSPVGVCSNGKKNVVGRTARVLVFRIIDNAHNFVVAAVALISLAEVLAYGILVGEKPARKSLVDNSDVWGSGTVALVDGASL